ncbi:transglutaminase family protein [Leptospira levettii]|uniref:Transglutaminase family protein n=1 Tax=Leptospira levettii TaxID=2023178 RepID=A0AAW5V6Z8_9LEPT|nr:transglutaminase family protein [Leptospira levettii]MCW7465542.1 transglutaminase family protein [Leptospira levettii]MCW7496379.1 transglutaminase family protein [Leptospira levettii]MCW7510281.1 transglutaminase family protein [Leptospira levettii]MCW7514033.1 transglutaminase family protein [Leptospira levettii]TGM29663.1 transglutaminase family protein [Leptospira levettii]
MSIRVALTHITTYQYDKSISLSPHVIRLRPAPHTKNHIVSYSLNILPEQKFLNWQQDPFGNYLARLVFPEKTNILQVAVDLVTDLKVINPFDFFVEEYAENYPFSYDKILKKELTPYLKPKKPGKLLSSYLKSIKVERKRVVEFLVALNAKVYNDIGYVIRMEPGVQSTEVTLSKRLGSCRDSAYLLVQILRHLGLAARFVSGYLIQLKADVKSLDGPSGTEVDFTDLHAWAEVYLPGAGWVGLDPTSGLFTGEGHIPLAATPEPESAGPIYGFAEKAKMEFSFSMHVERVLETPRVTLPYLEEDWNRILKLGDSINKRIKKNDIRLTIGGEPTFVSTENREAPEWNFDALGFEKYSKSEQLIKRLGKHFAEGGLLQYGQGKWYPGEPIPRWAMISYWRKDKEPLWRNPHLLSDDRYTGSANTDDARKFVSSLVKYLNVPSSSVLPAYEDNLYYLWQESNLPEETESLLDGLNSYDVLERKRILKVLDQGLHKEVGYVLPLDFDVFQKAWISDEWKFRRKKMFLIPGDSPIGLRLPLQSLGGKSYYTNPEDPFSPKSPLPKVKELSQYPLTMAKVSYPWGGVHTRTALCVEPRNGNLRVFLPPIQSLEGWLHLIYAIEQTALETDLPIVIEGYEAPNDPRLNRFKITPDPGVIEVNFHPSSQFEEIVEKTKILYEEAYQLRLTAEKFLIDGRHSGTGGGNHITLGGETAGDSPFLRKPSLLRSIVSYWQNHPGLSYLFSGLFIGPTSQSPRVDEARNDSLHELKIAFQQIDSSKTTPPWLLDRLLRNILIDVTGNTHRTEISIDKLFDPGSPTGRLGLIEMRAFEMPPHFQMSVVQQAFMMAIICKFWEEPYYGNPINWNTELHDRYMLPYFVYRDFKEVIFDLQNQGFSFLSKDFDPFFEFRFPQYGICYLDGMEIELRMALEPWNVLGEENTSQGTSRGVDSATERVQVKIKGFHPERYKLSCNGFEVPLQATSVQNEFVAGVRFKAWNPVFTLHPQLPSQQSLVFDVYDTWNHRSLGGCTYHVSHPGGLSYQTIPINAYEAESRRISRFWTHGHKIGKSLPPVRLENKAFPCTLDLRMVTSK